jgi:hypothetical protein
MRSRYVWLICGTAVVVVEVLRAVALRSDIVGGEALESLRHTLYLVAGIGAGRLEVSGRVGRAIWAGLQAGGVTGIVGCSVGQGLAWALGLETGGTMVFTGCAAAGDLRSDGNDRCNARGTRRHRGLGRAAGDGPCRLSSGSGDRSTWRSTQPPGGPSGRGTTLSLGTRIDGSPTCSPSWTHACESEQRCSWRAALSA